MPSTFTPSRIAISVGILAVFLIAWEWGPGALKIAPYIIPPMSDCAEGLLELFRTDKL